MRKLFNFIVKYPILVLISTLFVGFALILHVDKLEIDASSRTIMLDNDPDLLFASEINKRYGGGEFLVIAFTPNEELLSSENLQTIEKLTKEIEALKQVRSEERRVGKE